VQESEVDAYTEANPNCRVIAWEQKYFDEYEKTPELDPHPTTGAAHNFAWAHSLSEGFSHHWIMDDNIRYFLIRHNARRIRLGNAKALHWHEEFIQKWRNLAGLSLAMSPFMLGKPIGLNTRLYCATLYRNDLHEYGIKWRRGLNDDTIVSIDILKTGYWCTAESRLVGIQKIGTSRKGRMSGGMTDFYADGGFIKKSAELVRLHPDCTKTVIRFNRIHHVVDFSGFKQQLVPVDANYVPKVKSVNAKPAKKKIKSTSSKKTQTVIGADFQTGIDLAEQLKTDLHGNHKVMYPIYIPSKNRAGSTTTPQLLRESGVSFYVLVEPQDYENYQKYHPDHELLMMDKNDQGIDYARNFAKNHATENGHTYHWQLDDDVKAFRVRIDTKNLKTTGAHVLSIVEKVTNLYSNIGTAAPMYDTFAYTVPTPIKLNKMVASVMLFKNDPEIIFRPMIIDDIDVTMQYLDKGYCTLVFARALASLPTTPNDTGGMGAEARVGQTMRTRCENLVKQWGEDAFKVITKNNAPRIAPSRIWSTFKQQPHFHTSEEHKD